MKLLDDWRLWTSVVLFIAWWDPLSALKTAIFVTAWVLFWKAIGAWAERRREKTTQETADLIEALRHNLANRTPPEP